LQEHHTQATDIGICDLPGILLAREDDICQGQKLQLWRCAALAICSACCSLIAVLLSAALAICSACCSLIAVLLSGLLDFN
jgi:hypothetical protein